MKKILIIIILFIFLTGCNNQNKNPNDPTLESIIITSLPNKLTYFEDEQLDLAGLIVQGIYSNDETIIIEDYTIEYEFKIGENKVYIKFNNLITNFDITVNEIIKEKIEIIDYPNYLDKTINNIDFTDYDAKFTQVYYGATRGTNMFIAYDENYFVSTNIYGYEVAVDKYGVVVEKATNVNLPFGGLVLSAHGTSKEYVNSIELGDIVLYFNETVYVYKNKEIGQYTKVFTMFYELIDYVKTIDSIDEYNIYANKINEAIPLLNQFYEEYDKELLSYFIELFTISIEEIEYTHKYSYTEMYFDELGLLDNDSFSYQLQNVYEDKLYVGGFRNTNMLVYYDASCYRTRNAYGLEVGVDKNGIVVSKDTLVELEDGGFILSGHGTAASFLLDCVDIYDKVQIIDGKVYIYRDSKKMYYNYYSSLRNELVYLVEEDYNLQIPHDYEYIKYIINELDEKLKLLSDENTNLDFMIKFTKTINSIEQYLGIAYSQLIEYDATQTNGIWYYPFTKPLIYDDTSKEGVIKTIEKFKMMGINEIIIYVFAEKRCLFDCTMYNTYDKLRNYSYGEYGNDYLKCFIEECHKRNILVNAFTQTFHGYVYAMKTQNENYYQIDYQGELSKGNINYYDICNDNLQNEVINWYKELVTKYNFDKVEYDIIRYPSSNLYLYSDTDEALNASSITDHGYTEYSMNKFKEMYNLTGDLRELVRTNKDIRNNWLSFKEESLVYFITNCTREMKEINPNLVVTAAVFSDYNNAKLSYFQDYRKWLDLSIVDELDIMLYTPSNQTLVDVSQEFNDLYDGYNIRLGLSPRLDIIDIAVDMYQILYSTKKDGFILFSSTLYYDDTFVSILENNHHNPRINELCEKEEILKYELLDAIDMIEGYYSIKNNKSYEQLILSLNNETGYIEIINNLDDQLMKDYLLKKLNK